MAKVRPINLLPQEEFEASIMGRILRWAMGTFRFIVIVTEIVVMAAFLSRFWLDAQNSDLTDSIKVASAQITAQSDFEKEFKGIQAKLKIYKGINQSAQSTKKIGTLASKIPGDIILNSIILDSQSLSIRGTAASDASIAQLISNLKAEPTFKQVDLGGLDVSQSNPTQTNFSVKIIF